MAGEDEEERRKREEARRYLEEQMWERMRQEREKATGG
jgi:hypothetical protein